MEISSSSKNLILVGEREVGKTTYLFNMIDELINQGSTVIVLDSATDHIEKSLLKMVEKKYRDVILINVNDEKMLLSEQDLLCKKNVLDLFPAELLLGIDSQIICFDMSYFLELGHEIFEITQKEADYKYYREKYNNISQQIVTVLIYLDYLGLIKNTVVVMDEIELPLIDCDIAEYQKNISFIAAVHEENSFGTFYKSFVPIKNKTLRKR